MGDVFQIDKIEKLIANNPVLEISDFSKIIKIMIEIKNDIPRQKQKKTRTYNISDKISMNQFSMNLKAKIEKHHIDSYDIVEDAINCIEEVEASIRSDLYDYYWEVYTDVLSDMAINIKDEGTIKSKSDIIYSELVQKIYVQIFDGKASDIETNKKITYLHAITAYVFYKCKFLIPIERD